MAKQDLLADLINSLSKPEKRYFKLFASRYKQSGEKKYLRIFRAIDGLDGKDPERTIARLTNGQSGSLAGDRHYLTELLLDSLRQFHSGSTVQTRLGNELLSAEMLRRKGLFQHALRRVHRVKKKALLFELPELVMQCITLESEIRSTGVIEWPAVSSVLAAEMESWLMRMLHLNRINQARLDQLQLSVGKGRPQTPQERQEWLERLKFFDPEESLTGLVTEKLIRLRAYSHVYFVLQDPEATDRINRQQYELYHAHPEQIEKSPIDYIAFLYRHISTSTILNNFDEAARLLGKLRAIRREHADSPSSEIVAYIDDRLLSSELFLFGKSGNFDQMRKRSAEADAFLKTVDTRQQSVIGFNLSTAFMFSADYHKVLYWTHRALSHSECRKDYILFLGSNLHQVIAHTELGDFDTALSHARTAQRFVIQRKEKHEGTDLALVELLARCAATDDTQKRARLAGRFLEDFRRDPWFLETTEFIAVRAWLEGLLLRGDSRAAS